jgi:hypothetical protein
MNHTHLIRQFIFTFWVVLLTTIPISTFAQDHGRLPELIRPADPIRDLDANQRDRYDRIRNKPFVQNPRLIRVLNPRQMLKSPQFSISLAGETHRVTTLGFTDHGAGASHGWGQLDPGIIRLSFLFITMICGLSFQ